MIWVMMLLLTLRQLLSKTLKSVKGKRTFQMKRKQKPLNLVLLQAISLMALLIPTGNNSKASNSNRIGDTTTRSKLPSNSKRNRNRSSNRKNSFRCVTRLMSSHANCSIPATVKHEVRTNRCIAVFPVVISITMNTVQALTKKLSRIHFDRLPGKDTAPTRNTKKLALHVWPVNRLMRKAGNAVSAPRSKTPINLTGCSTKPYGICEWVSSMLNPRGLSKTAKPVRSTSNGAVV